MKHLKYYLNEIKNPTGNVICGFPGIGKSTLFKELKGSGMKVQDSDSSTFDKKEFPENYIKHIKEKTAEGYTILASSHDVVRDALIANKIKFTLIYPDKSLKDEYLTRYKERGSPESFVSLLSNNWDKWIGQCENLTNPLVSKVVLKSGEFLNAERAGMRVTEASNIKSQRAMIAQFKSDDTDAKMFKKSGTFKARKGKVGEHIITVIDGEEETKKTVIAGEVVIEGPKGERYVVSEKKFKERYEVDKDLTEKFQNYKTKGLIKAYEYKGPSFKFRASWDEEMLCKEGDYLATPVKNEDDTSVPEVYRIERSVFDITYKEIKDE